jgi:trehalose/maltose transport system substrate-binding protein
MNNNEGEIKGMNRQFLKTVVMVSMVAVLFGVGNSLFAKEKQVKITVTSSATPTEFKTVKDIAKIYMKEHPNVKVEVYPLPMNSSERIALYLQTFEAKSGNLDVLGIDGICAGDMAKNLLNLNKYGVKKLTDTMFSPMVEGGLVDGRQVSIPWYADSPGLYYRKDLLKKYNLKVPKTWNDLAKAAYIIQEGERKTGNPDFVGYVWQGEAYEGLTCNALEWLYSNGGGTIVSKDKKVTVNNQNAVNAIKMAKSWLGTISPRGVLSMKEEQSRSVFQGGNAAFMRNWQYAYVLAEEKGSKIKGKVGVCSMPKGFAGIAANTSGIETIGVNRFSKNPKVAADFAIYLCSAKAQKLRALDAGLCPTIKTLYNDKEISRNPAFKLFYDIFQNGVNRPAIQTAPNYSQVSKIFYTEVYSVLNGENDAASALSEAAKKISAITKLPIAK